MRMDCLFDFKNRLTAYIIKFPILTDPKSINMVIID